MIATINRHLDGLVRPELPVLGRPRSAFQVCGFAGLVAAIALVGGLTSRLALEPWVAGVLVLAAASTFLIVAIASKALLGRTELVLYRQALVVAAVVGGVSAALDRPVLRYLDLTAVGVVCFVAFGRVGCLMVGCCHGQPAGLGVRYKPAHAVAGFSPLLVGVRLFPTQALEALAAAVLATGGAVALAVDAPAPGLVVAALAVGYALVRFLLETARGDRFRPIVAGFSEAQWTSVAVIGGIAALGAAGWIPARGWQLAAAVAIGFVVFFIAAWRYLGNAPRHRLLHPAHVHEVATALDELPRRQRPDRIDLATTSLGVRLSTARIALPAGCVEQITISHRDGALPEENARIVVDLVRDLCPGRGRPQIVATKTGAIHVLFLP